MNFGNRTLGVASESPADGSGPTLEAGTASCSYPVETIIFFSLVNQFSTKCQIEFVGAGRVA